MVNGGDTGVRITFNSNNINQRYGYRIAVTGEDFRTKSPPSAEGENAIARIDCPCDP